MWRVGSKGKLAYSFFFHSINWFSISETKENNYGNALPFFPLWELSFPSLAPHQTKESQFIDRILSSIDGKQVYQMRFRILTKGKGEIWECFGWENALICLRFHLPRWSPHRRPTCLLQVHRVQLDTSTRDDHIVL